jgi:predicted transposase YdaD
MLYHEFNMDKALAVSRDEGREEGEVRGIEIGREEGEAKTRELLALLESGVSLAEAKRKFGY